ncbi:MAG: hypothetical protein NUV55_00600 [Sulfuricaulis sp.]|uniref:hypothetical protein n=1 Tax=Sulfuricaulis sp. TaxID=2003553 RepID=UPI0025F9B803|nr:hypothetical protein [Sulfuricaulis sp.]MCR4345696.1 hypothetical protein [Sulfuricaulis sp.]
MAELTEIAIEKLVQSGSLDKGNGGFVDFIDALGKSYRLKFLPDITQNLIVAFNEAELNITSERAKQTGAQPVKILAKKILQYETGMNIERTVALMNIRFVDQTTITLQFQPEQLKDMVQALSGLLANLESGKPTQKH